MKKWVSKVEKREFLNWFITQYRLKNHEARRLIEVIMNNPHILENLSFTEKINEDMKTIVISSIYSDEPGFVFYNNYHKVNDVSSAIASISYNPSEKLCIVLHFHGKMLNHRYLQLIETPESENIKLNKIHQEQVTEVDAVMEKVSLDRRINDLKGEIDLALDQRDAHLFKKLTDQLQVLQLKSSSLK